MTKSARASKNKPKTAKPWFKNELLINIGAVLMVAGIIFSIAYFSDQHRQKQRLQQVQGVEVIAYDGEEGKTALELLQRQAVIENFDTPYGVYVGSINKVENSETHYWLMYLNGEVAPDTADRIQTKNNDKIEWRYEELKFEQ